MKGGTYRWIDERDRSRRMRRKGMMSSFNPVPLPSPVSSPDSSSFFSVSLSSRTIFSRMQLGVCECLCFDGVAALLSLTF